MKRLVDITGMRFGNWTVIERAPIEGRVVYWKCRCACGTTKKVESRNLRHGKSRSCGCSWASFAPPNQLERGKSAFNRLFNQYKTGAKIRGISFDLSKTEFKSIVGMDCFYCGLPPSQLTKFPAINGQLTYTGIDRLDPKLGYQRSNVAPCCKDCNYAKKDMLPHEYLAHVDRVATFQRRAA